MNIKIVRFVFTLSILMVSMTAASIYQGPQYTINPINNDRIAMDIKCIGGTPAENSVLDYRWYWSYDERFNIEFEGAVGSDDITDGSEWNAVSNALDTWENVPGASITSTLNAYDGDWALYNLENELAWIETGWESFGDFGFGIDVIGVAVTLYYTDTLEQIESDIFFNGEYFNWYTETDDGGWWEAQFVEHIALHELGHAFSLDDVYLAADSDRTMYGYSGNRIEDITLTSADGDALNYAYPVPEPTTVLLLGLGGLVLRLRSEKAREKN